jgi:hypothetical protein
MELNDIHIFLQVLQAGTMVAATTVFRIDHSTIRCRRSRLNETPVVRDRALFRPLAADEPIIRPSQSSHLPRRELIHNAGAGAAFASAGIATGRTIAAISHDGFL